MDRSDQGSSPDRSEWLLSARQYRIIRLKDEVNGMAVMPPGSLEKRQNQSKLVQCDIPTNDYRTTTI